MTHAEEIHKTWARFRGPWPTAEGVDGRYPLPVVRLVIQQPLPRFDLSKPPPATSTARMLDFMRETGSMDGRPWYRIVCEGVVVEDGPA